MRSLLLSLINVFQATRHKMIIVSDSSTPLILPTVNVDHSVQEQELNLINKFEQPSDISNVGLIVVFLSSIGIFMLFVLSAFLCSGKNY